MNMDDFLHGPALWFANRGTGIMLLVLLTIATMLGVLSTSRATNPIWPRMLSQGLHRNVSLLSVVFLAAHTATAVADSFVDIRWFDAFVPFISPYEPLYTGFAALALDLMVAVVVTSILRHRMSHRPWRAIHVLAYSAWGLGFLHGLQGTDSANIWGTAVNYACVAAVSLAVLARFGLLVRRPKVVIS